MSRRKRPDHESERDMIHELFFVRKEWKYGDSDAGKHFPPVRAISDPKTNEYALKSAIADFQRQHGVADWQEIAAAYEIRSYWYG